MSYGQTSSTLWGPKPLVLVEHSRDFLEFSVHTLPKPLLREFSHVFDERHLKFQSDTVLETDDTPELLAIPTNQFAREDLVGVGEKVEMEKDRLLNVFMAFARALCQRIRDAGYWADFIDPCSGLPMLTLSCNKVYSEVDGMECLLNYKNYNAGFCKILTHPKWGSAVYPATIFTYAPPQLVIELMAKYPVFQE
jgi:hypothetical protein